MKVIKHKHKLHFLVTTMLVSGTLLYFVPPHFGDSHAAEPNKDSVDTKFAVQVEETLAMNIRVPGDTDHPDEAWAKDDTHKFLRNELILDIASNNPRGFTTGMTAEETTSLKHTVNNNVTIPTLATTNVARTDDVFDAFPVNSWGFSLDDKEKTGKYNPIPEPTAAPVTIASSTQNDKVENKSVFFGAKADETVSSGTYAGKVKFYTVAGNNGADLPSQNKPSTPSNPSNPSNEPSAPSSTPGNTASVTQTSVPTYTYTTGTRTYSSTSTRQVAMNSGSGADEADATIASNEETKPKATETEDGYLAPLGVVDRTTGTTQAGSPVTHILVTVASVTTVVGAGFFAAAKFHDKMGD